MEHVIYDGVDLAERFTCIGVVRPLPIPTPRSETLSGSSRLFFRGMDIVPPAITFRLVSVENTAQGRRDALRWLASTLLVQQPVMLSFSDEPNMAYKVVPSGEAAVVEHVSSGAVDVTLQCIESAMYGERKSATSSGGTVNITVGGNWPTSLRISSTTAVRQSSSDYRWGVTIDNGSVAYVEIPTSSSSTVVLDADSRHATVNGSTAQLTLQSDWMDVEAGTHTVARSRGTGEFKVEWVERWV